MVHILKNPHSVLAVLDTRPQDVLEVSIPQKIQTEIWEVVAKQAKDKKIPVLGNSRRNSKPLKGAAFEESSRLSVAEATVRERVTLSPLELFGKKSQSSTDYGLWLALDSLQDPHNVGAIFRVAAFFGVRGILMTQERSAPITASAYDVASGGLEYVPFAIYPNLQRAFEIAKEAGLWILGTSEHANDPFSKIQRDRSWLLVFGNEEKGMRRLTEESCDVLCRIPGKGKVTSLNVSVAAGIMISMLT